MFLPYIINFLATNIKSIRGFGVKILASGFQLDWIVNFVLIPWKMETKYVQMICERGLRIGILGRINDCLAHHISTIEREGQQGEYITNKVER